MELISIVIPTINRYESLVRTINKLCQGTVVPDEIIVVDQTEDNTISENIRTYLSNISVKTKYYHQSQPSLTMARKNGMTMVKNDLVIQMDDDVDVKIDTLENVNNIFVDKNISMVAGINEDGGPSGSLRGYIFGKKSYKNRNIGHVTIAMYGRFPQKCQGRVETQWAMGFFFVIRKHLVDKWNIKWDENLKGYAYAEDLAFSYEYYLKSKSEGYRCIISSSVIVKHNVSTEWRLIPKKHTYMIVLHREYLSYKFTKSHLGRIATRWSNFGELLRRLLNKENVLDVVKAQFMCDRYRKDIKNGKFHYELFL